jgi:hypothetical protein
MSTSETARRSGTANQTGLRGKIWDRCCTPHRAVHAHYYARDGEEKEHAVTHGRQTKLESDFFLGSRSTTCLQ